MFGTCTKYIAKLTISLITAASMVLLKEYLYNKKNRDMVRK